MVQGQLKELVSYTNGNTFVTLYEDGTKVRSCDFPVPVAEFPETMDVKITNYCDLGCTFCHESSTTKGKHGDLGRLLGVLVAANLPKGIELAIGGGNPMAHPDLEVFLGKCKQYGWICNITVNAGHLSSYISILCSYLEKGLIKAIGISVPASNSTADLLFLHEVSKLYEYTNNIVFHIIAGVHSHTMIPFLNSEFKDCKILVLGYKEFGLGKKFYSSNEVTVNKGVSEMSMFLNNYITKYKLSFDNLGIEQLNLRRFFSEEEWSQLYMGDDFTFSMYIDAVTQKFAPTSRSSKRVSWDDTDLLEFFNSRHEQ